MKSVFRPICVVLMLILSTIIALAQDRIESEVLYFDKKWKPTEKRGCKFYRVFGFENNLFIIKDYYCKGQLQFEGAWLLKDSSETSMRFLSNLSSHHAVGTAKWYYKNGQLKSVVDHLPIGQPCDTTKDYRTACSFYNRDGTKSHSWTELNGKIDGMLFYYDQRDGEVAATQEMSLGKAHGKHVQYATDRGVYCVTEYENDLKHGKSVIYYEYPGRPKQLKVYEKGKLILTEDY